MPDSHIEPTKEQSNSSVEINPIEQEILELEKQLAAKKAVLQEKPLEQVLVKEQPAVSAAPTVAVPLVSPVTPPTAVIKAEVHKISRLEKNQQLKGLVDLAFQKGINYATEVVRNLDNPYLLDEFHDTLVDKLHKELVERGKLEEI